MDMKFKILRGLEANLSAAPKVDGYWYLTTDTAKLFVCIGGELKPVSSESFDPTEINNKISQLETDVESLKGQVASGNVVTKNTYEELPNVGSENSIYIVKAENATYRWTGEKYEAVGRDYKELNLIDGGTASDFTNI